MMTELADMLQEYIEDGISIRAIARKAGMSDSTVRQALAGESLSHQTIEKFAAYLKLPKEEVFRMAGILPPMHDADGRLSRSWMLSKLWELLVRLPEEDQALVLAEAVRLNAKYRDKEDGDTN